MNRAKLHKFAGCAKKKYDFLQNMGVIDVLLGAVNELHQHKTEQHEANATHHSDKDFVTHSYVNVSSI